MNCILKWNKVFGLFGGCTCFTIFAFLSAFGLADVSRVFIRGNSSEYGMKIEDANVTDTEICVETNMYRIIYYSEKSSLEIYKKATLTPMTEIVMSVKNSKVRVYQNTADHVLLAGDRYDIGIYGDSTLLLNSDCDSLEVKIVRYFKTEYAGHFENEWEFVGTNEGVGIYPQRPCAGLRAGTLKEQGSQGHLKYILGYDQRIMFSFFPSKRFDVQRSYDLRVLHTAGCTDREKDISTGILPSDDVIRKWSKYTNVLTLHATGFYSGHNMFRKSGYRFPEQEAKKWTFGGPWIPAKPEELRRLVLTAHECSMKVLCYTSPFFHYKTPNVDAYLLDVKQLLDTYNIDGIYVDTLYIDKKYPGGEIICDKITNWELMRRLREIVGPEKLIYYHGSSDKSLVASVPNIDALCDIVLYGEDVPFTKWEDEYIQYQVRKYGISNTIGMIKPEKRPDNMSMNNVVDGMLSFNGRMRWVAYPEDGSNGQCVWPTEPPSYMKYYYHRLDELKKAYVSDGR